MINQRGIYFQYINYEELCREKIAQGRDFFVDTDFDMVNIDKLELLTEDTIYSAKRFGPQKYEREEVQKYRYSCKCGAKIGNDMIGEYCPECSSVVEKKEFPLDILGWIKLPTKTLTPLGAYTLRLAMSGKSTQKREGKSKDGEKAKTITPKYVKLKEGKAPFKQDDLYHLYDRFEEVLEPHIKNKKKFELMCREKDRLFTNVYPVISRRLRRFMVTMNGDVPVIQADELSVMYTEIISIVNFAKSGALTDKAKRFIAKGFVDCSEKIYEKLSFEANDNKEKAIKGEIYSTKNPYSARILVEPDNVSKSGRGDLVRTSYDIFRTIHKEEIIKICQEEYGMSVLETDKLTDSDFVLSEADKKLLRDILHKKEWWMFINRPPSIDMSAILACEIGDLCEENILYMNPIICGLVRGDFDGDTFSCYVIPMDLKWRLKESCNPRRHSVWWNREINSAYGPINDHVVTTHMMLGEGGVEFL